MRPKNGWRQFRPDCAASSARTNRWPCRKPVGLARELRHETLAMIAAGKSDGEIVDFMVSRYGDFIRYQPPFKPSTWLLWAGPFLWLAGGLGLLLVVLRRQGHAAEAPLNAADRQRADRLLADESSDRVEKDR